MNLEAIIAKFAEDAKVDAKLAKRIIDKLAENELFVEKMNSIIRRLKDFFVKNEYWSFLSKLKDDTIQKVVDEMIADEMRMQVERAEDYKETSMRLFNEFNEEWKVYQAGDEVKIQIMRTGERDHPAYWKVKVTKDTLKDVIKNFENRERWIDLAVDENHEWNHRSLARFKDVYAEGKEALFAILKLTKKGAELLTEGAYKYFSPEIVFTKKDEESWKIIKNLLLWGAFTNRPFFKNMQPLFATEAADTKTNEFSKTSSVFLFNQNWPMKTLIQLLAKFGDTSVISKSEQETIKNLFAELDTSEQEQFKEHVDEALAFNASEESNEGSDDEEDKDTDEDKDSEDEGDDAGDDDAWKSDDAADDVPGDLPEVKANEDWMYTFSEEQMSLFKWIISKASATVAAARREKITSQVQWLAFNEQTKKWLLLPSNVEGVVNFALSLNEKQSDQFFKIMKALKVVAFGEVWHAKEVKKSVETSDEYKFFTEKMQMTPEEARQAIELANSKDSK